MEFARAIVDEAHAFNVINMQVLEFDEELAEAEKATTEAITAGDTERATRLARELRRLILALGYADEDELPTETAPEA